MNSITRRVLVRCTREAAIVALAGLADEDPATGATALTINAAVRLQGLGADIALRNAPRIEFTHADPDERPDSVHVRWIPYGEETFPRFFGTLLIRPDGETTCWLTLEGSYDERKPSSRVLDAGERAMGYRLALATAASLLESVAVFIERNTARTVGAYP